MADLLKIYTERLERLARDKGLDYDPVDFELVPPSFMMEVAVYGLPVRMPHWSFGMRYIYQLVQHRMGHSHIFEVVFPGNPGRAYLANTNSLEENTLVTAHVLGHADFSKNNELFRQSQRQVGYHIVEQAAARARQIADAMDEHGVERVEAVLDAALALEQQIDLQQDLRRPRYPEYRAEAEAKPTGAFAGRFRDLPGEETVGTRSRERQRMPIPPYPEHDLLWFIAQYAPEMEAWERDIFLMVREESYYFHPVFACQIMNEGWASYWHAHLLREADFLPQSLYLEAIKTHSDVVRPYAGESQIALSVNPYHLGFSIWEKLIEHDGMAAARRIMQSDDDFGFIRNYLDTDLAEALGLFRYTAKTDGEIQVIASDIDDLREAILAPKFNFGAPHIVVVERRSGGELVLRHQHEIDGRGLDLERAVKVLGYIRRVWRRPLILHTVDQHGDEQVLATG